MKQLTGSPKQIAWAEDIIKRNIKKLTDRRDEYIERMARDGVSDFTSLIEKLNKALEQIENSEYDAKYWIEHSGLADMFIQKITGQR